MKSKKNQLFPEINIIHLPHRIDRKQSIIRELSEQGISRFKFWQGFLNSRDPAFGISESHKQIVQDAKNRKLATVIIAEDDIYFTAPGAFNYFCENQPLDYDLYLGAISYGKINSNQIVSNFSGLLLYQVHERFYDKFLDMPPDQHLDRALRGKGLYEVCPAFVVVENNSLSDNSGKEIDNRIYYKDRPLFGREPIKFQ
ncbi:MAG TPA: hypothetical protein VFI29_18175 [Hanamia sp.]|nr:hypothetical protein [Hanamia sp.]